MDHEEVDLGATFRTVEGAQKEEINLVRAFEIEQGKTYTARIRKSTGIPAMNPTSFPLAATRIPTCQSET